MLKMIKAFVDASFDADKKVCGIGIFIQDGVKQRTVSNFINTDSVNFGEMWAIYTACILLHGKDATVYTDSQTALQYLTTGVKDKPRTREQYIRHRNMQVMAHKIKKLGVAVDKVKAHQKVCNRSATSNNVADMLAKLGRSKYYEKNS